MFVISLDGPDGCGKTTIANLLLNILRERVKNKRIVRTALPSEMITGALTTILRNSADKISPEVFALVYAADHLHHYKTFMRTLPDDSIVIQERSLLSSIIYQGLIGGLDMEWLRGINKYCKNIPDLTLIIRTPTRVLLEREIGEAGHDVFEDGDHIKKQARAYYDLPSGLVKEFNVKLIDGTGTPLNIAERCYSEIINSIR